MWSYNPIHVDGFFSNSEPWWSGTGRLVLRLLQSMEFHDLNAESVNFCFALTLGGFVSIQYVISLRIILALLSIVEAFIFLGFLLLLSATTWSSLESVILNQSSFFTSTPWANCQYMKHYLWPWNYRNVCLDKIHTLGVFVLYLQCESIFPFMSVWKKNSRAYLRH